MHKRLFIPGPVDVKEDVLEQMTKAIIGHRTKTASDLQRGISRKLQQLLYTEDQILLSTSSGSGLMEGAIRSCTRKRAAVFSSGYFGDLWYKMAISNNVEADLFKVPAGQVVRAELVDKVLSTGKYDLVTITHNETATGVTNPIEEIGEVLRKYPEVVWCLDGVSSVGGIKVEVDRLGIDLCIASTQKCLGLPPGMAIASISEKAVEAAKKVKYRGIYLDLLKIYECVEELDYQYHSTPNILLMYAMDYQLDKILEEGLEERFARHREMAEYVRSWAMEHFQLLPAKLEYASNTVTTIKNTRNIDIELLNARLGERGYQISNGYGDLRDKTFRIGHMADYTLEDVKGLLKNIDDILGLNKDIPYRRVI